MVALDGGYQCQSYACIAAGGLDDGGARLQDALLLGVFNHRQGDTVFYATARIEILYFGNNGCLQSLCL